MISTPPAYLVGIVAAHQHPNSIIGLSSSTVEKMKVLLAKNIEDIKPLIIIVENVLLHVHVARVKRRRRVAAGADTANHRYQYLVLLLRDHQNLDAVGRSKSASYAKDALKQLCNIEIIVQECTFVPVYHEEEEIHL